MIISTTCYTPVVCTEGNYVTSSNQNCILIMVSPTLCETFWQRSFTHLNHCKVLLSYSGIINKFCLLMWISVKCIQSSWLFECKAYCMHFIIFLWICVWNSARPSWTSVCVFMFASLCYSTLYASVSCRVRAHAKCGARHLTKTRCLLYYQH